MAPPTTADFAPSRERHHRRVGSEQIWHEPQPRLAPEHARRPGHKRITKDSRIALLDYLSEDADLDHPDPLADLRRSVEELQCSVSSDGTSHDDFRWDARQVPLSELRLPPRQPHSGTGRFEWIGQENHFPANYLWDSKTDSTVFATPAVLKDGYIAVSWTWGRFQSKNGTHKIFLDVPGTKWRVPSLPRGSHGRELLSDMKSCLRKIPDCRYFWVDVLCIDQGFGSGRERQAEIEKQAKIFADAKGVVCYLWQEEESESLCKAIQGLGELLDWALVFGEPPEESSQFEATPDPHCFHHLFNKLRSNDWFTSLWTLQEIVLAPAGVWLTRFGHVCQVNGQPVTTRMVAMIVRLLSWAVKHRERMWYEARRDYIINTRRSEKDIKILQDNYRKRKDRMPAVPVLDPTKLRERLRGRPRLGSHHADSPARATSTSPPLGARTDSELAGLTPRPTNSRQSSTVTAEVKLPWIIRRHEAEAVLRDEIKAWTDWSFSIACIDISLTATRAAIIVAGSHRKYVDDDAREAALLAALKVQPDKRFFLKRTPTNLRGPTLRGHLSPLLMNMLLLAEQRCHIFNVTHAVSRWSINRYLLDKTDGAANDLHHGSNAINDLLDTSQLSSSTVYKNFVEDHDGSALTDMLPDSASGIHSELLHFTSRKRFDWSLTTGWHMHQGGALHIPPGVPIQRITKENGANRKRAGGFAVWLRPNGSPDSEHVLRSHKDLRRFCAEHRWLLRLLGRNAGASFRHPRFIFLPLGTRMTTLASVESAVERSVRWFQPNTRESIGVVLVSTAAEQGKPHSVWHKFGDYHAKGLRSTPLKSSNGIFVTAYHDRASVDGQDESDCEAILQDVAFALNVVRRQPTAMSDWDMVTAEDYMLDSDDAQYASDPSSESDQDVTDIEPRSPAYRTVEEYHFRELARGIRSAMRFQTLHPG